MIWYRNLHNAICVDIVTLLYVLYSTLSDILDINEKKTLISFINPLKTVQFWYNMHFPFTAARDISGLALNGLTCLCKSIKDKRQMTMVQCFESFVKCPIYIQHLEAICKKIHFIYKRNKS